jgi:DNA-binding response OmpR family regulator
MATNPVQAQVSHQARQHTLLIATSRQHQRAFLAAQLDADGHTVYEADTTTAVIARLSARPIDALVLGELAHPADGPAFLRAARAGEHPRIYPGLAVITLGATDELTVLRAYESGSDHHLPHDTGYLLLRAVLQSVVRRSLEDITARYLQAGDIGVDLAARSANVAGNVVHLSRLEFELLVKFTSRDQLARCIWRQQQISARTVDSHVATLRTRLTAAGADEVLVNKWGQGWSLITPR